MKKIYFACSIAGGRDHAHVYADMVQYIKASGAKVLCELFAEKELKPEVGLNMDPADVWKRDLDWVRLADAIIADVTQPSLGVGYELGKAEEWSKPILALFYQYPGKRLSPMIAGSTNITTHHYKDLAEAETIISRFLKSL